MTLEDVAAGLSEAQKRIILRAEPMGDRWWMEYSPGEKVFEELNIFRFGAAQFTPLGLALRHHLQSRGEQ